MPKKLSTSSKASPRYNNDCSAKGIASNFIKIRKDAAVSKPISTGSIIGDYAITKIPYIGQAIKAYNKGSFGGSHLAHGINAYNEVAAVVRKNKEINIIIN